MSLSVSDFDALLAAAMQRHHWLAAQFRAAKRRELVSALAGECQFQLNRNETDAQKIGARAASAVLLDPRAIPDWLAAAAFERLADFIAQWLLDRQRAPADFAKGEVT